VTTAQRIPAKASETGDRSDAIVVSFDAKWYEAIIARAFSLVIRKRIPTSYKPQWLYFHVNAPKSAICARARLTSVAYMPTKLVRTLASELSLHSAEIDEYCRSLEEVGVYRIVGIELASVETSVAELQRQLIYAPPQSFMFLSHRAKAIIDEACKFIEVPRAPRTGTRQ
jgi:hypothetical protein